MTRREARELLMKMLYEGTFHPEKSGEEILEVYIQNIKGKTKKFIEEEFRGILQNKEEIEAIIEQSASNWKISRIAKIDYVLLLMGTYELKWSEDIPPKVAINEMIEIAKIYSTDKSPKFIHGVLGKVSQTIEG